MRHKSRERPNLRILSVLGFPEISMRFKFSGEDLWEFGLQWSEVDPQVLPPPKF